MRAPRARLTPIASIRYCTRRYFLFLLLGVIVAFATATAPLTVDTGTFYESPLARWTNAFHYYATDASEVTYLSSHAKMRVPWMGQLTMCVPLCCGAVVVHYAALFSRVVADSISVLASSLFVGAPRRDVCSLAIGIFRVVFRCRVFQHNLSPPCGALAHRHHCTHPRAATRRRAAGTCSSSLSRL